MFLPVFSEYSLKFILVSFCLAVTTKLDISATEKEIAKGKEEDLSELEDEPNYSNKVAVELDEDDEAFADEIARVYGFKNNGRVGSLRGIFEFEHDKSNDIRERRSLKAKSLAEHPRVKWAEEQVELQRFKRGFSDDEPRIDCKLMKDKRESFQHVSREKLIQSQKREDRKYFKDPRFEKQWYLNNYGQDDLPSNNDINVLPVYKRGISGKGVVVSVLDDGLDHTHPDLKRNYDPKASTNLNKKLPGYESRDPHPRDEDPYNAHGTKCGGEIGAQANNDVCGAGIAPNVKLGGVRMLDGSATDSLEAHALSFNRDYIDIYSNCWGPKDNGRTFGRPGKLGMKALEEGAKFGRKGKGSIFVWATGNGGADDDNCNCDGYTSSIYTISIGAISVYGLSTYYDEKCSSTSAVIFTGDTHRSHYKGNHLVTTNLHHKCAKYFRGTSAAAPLAVGVFALVLEANRNLTWRDMQHIIVKTAKNTSECDPGWRRNAAGNTFNIKFGFGRIDADAMVTAALKWKNVPEQLNCTLEGASKDRNIPRGGRLVLTDVLSGCALTKLEHVQLIVTLKHRRRGDLSIVIKSPQATESTLLATRRLDNSLAGLYGWAFMTLHLWGENPAGKWQVFFADNPETKNQKKSTEQDIEDLERQIIEERRKERRDGISGTVEDPRDEIHHGRTREDYIRGEEIPAEDVSRRGEIPYDIYDRDSPIAGYIVKYSYVFWGTKD